MQKCKGKGQTFFLQSLQASCVAKESSPQKLLNTNPSVNEINLQDTKTDK